MVRLLRNFPEQDALANSMRYCISCFLSQTLIKKIRRYDSVESQNMKVIL